ncbi:MAG TPA: permease-like cell division protein FtsX [Actinomycetota bacterium]|nr:permease-like cell division protein FtsX [Actinomycetota bacterium]
MALKVRYFLRESAANLRRNLLMTVAASLTAAVSLLLLGGVLTLGDLVRGFTFHIEEGVEVSVFLVDDITAEQQTEIQRQIEDLEVVRGTTFVSKADAYEEYKEIFRDKPVMWESVSEDDLPASFRVHMRDPERVDMVKSRLQGNPRIDDIEDHREAVGRIVRVTGMLRTFSGAMIAVLLVAAVLLISNTIQMAIFARRKEIEIMKLVGATNWFVRVPFVLEGIAVGVVGAGVALGILSAAKYAIKQFLPPFIPTPFLQVADARHILWLVLLGSLIGAVGSSVALRRYLDV